MNNNNTTHTTSLLAPDTFEFLCISHQSAKDFIINTNRTEIGLLIKFMADAVSSNYGGPCKMTDDGFFHPSTGELFINFDGWKEVNG